MKVSRADYEKCIVGNGWSYTKTADALGVSKSAVARAARKYRGEEEYVAHNTCVYGENDDVTKQVKELERQLRLERQKVNDLRRGLGRHIVIKEMEPHFKVALISDTHYGSLYHAPDETRAFLQHARERGVRHVLHAGDVLEGEKMHFGQDRELSHHGITQQLEALGQQYPRDIEGLDVSFIIGNHDISYRKQSGIDVGAAIAYEMGWEHLGDCFGEVKYETENGDYRIALLHPGGGTSYALSYRMQKIIEQWEGGKKPDCLVAGHFHKAMWLPSYRNVSAIHPGCFQKQTPFMASKGLAAHVAGVILDVTVGKEWKSVKSEFVTFY